jgi:hypothetical protein
VITTDGSSSFKNKQMAAFSQYLHIKFHINTPYRAPSHGCVEKLNHTLMQLIRSVLVSHGSHWSDALPALRLSLNTSPNRTTGHSPFFLCYGQHPRLLLHSALNLRVSQVLGEHAAPSDDPFAAFAAERVNLIAKVWQEVRDREHDAFVAARARLYSKRKRERTLDIGDYCLHFKPRTIKTDPLWHGPYLVIARLSPLIYLIQDLNTSQTHQVHINDLIYYHIGSRTHAQLKAEALSLSQRLVSHVISHRMLGSQVLLNVEWLAFGEQPGSDPSAWVPLEHVAGEPPVIDYCQTHGIPLPVA